MQPKMTESELALFQSAIKGKECVLEFGVGGSTLLLVDGGAKWIVSIDSDSSWVRAVAEHDHIMPHVNSGRLTILHADIGRTLKWGYPVDDQKQDDWQRYWTEPWAYVDPAAVDLVFIDGRFRAACGLNALLMGSGNMTIMVHDFWHRIEYHVLLKYVNCACRSGSLAVLFPKQRIDRDELQSDLDRCALIPR